jgi:hypothetical protein
MQSVRGAINTARAVHGAMNAFPKHKKKIMDAGQETLDNIQYAAGNYTEFINAMKGKKPATSPVSTVPRQLLKDPVVSRDRILATDSTTQQTSADKKLRTLKRSGSSITTPAEYDKRYILEETPHWETTYIDEQEAAAAEKKRLYRQLDKVAKDVKRRKDDAAMEKRYQATKRLSADARAMDKYADEILGPPKSIPGMPKPWGRHVHGYNPELQNPNIGWEQWRAQAASNVGTMSTLSLGGTVTGMLGDKIIPGAGPWIGFLGAWAAGAFMERATKEKFDNMLGVDKNYWGTNPTQEQLDAIEKANDEDIKGAILFGTLSGFDYVWQQHNAGLNHNVFRGSHDTINQVRQLMSPEQLRFISNVQAAQPALFGELTVPSSWGDNSMDAQLGSFRVYLYKMVQMNFPYAQRVLGPMIGDPNDHSSTGVGPGDPMTIIQQFMSFEYPKVVSNFMQRYLAYEGTKGLIFLFKQMSKKKRSSILGVGGRKKKRKRTKTGYGSSTTGVVDSAMPAMRPSEGRQYMDKTKRKRVRFDRPTPKMKPKVKPKPREKVKMKPKPMPQPLPPPPEPKPKPKPKPRVRAKPKMKSGRTRTKVEYKKKKKKKKKYVWPRPIERKSDTKKNTEIIRETLLALFRRLDKDKSGRLTVKEVKKLAKRLGMSGPELMKAMDQSNDGYIEFKEFERYMRQRTSEVL